MQTHLAGARQDMHTDAIPATTSLQTSLSLVAAILSRARASSAIPSGHTPAGTPMADTRRAAAPHPHSRCHSAPALPLHASPPHSILRATLSRIHQQMARTHTPPHRKGSKSRQTPHHAMDARAGLLTTREPCPRVYAHGMPTCSPAG